VDALRLRVRGQEFLAHGKGGWATRPYVGEVGGLHGQARPCRPAVESAVGAGFPATEATRRNFEMA